MNRINFSNYEAWLLDYAEGNLSAEDTAELLLFMEQHPELKTDVDNLMEFILPSDEIISADFKQQLHKNDAAFKEHFENLCIAFYDKTITAAEKNELESALKQNPHWIKEFKAFAHVYIQQESDLEFTAKSSLKKQFQPEGSFDDLAVKALEGLLSEREKSLFDASLQGDTSKQFQWKAFQKTVLPKEHIVFEEKAALYQHAGDARVFPLWSRWIAVAASLALLFGVYSLLTNKGESGSGMASIQPDSIQQVRPVQPKNSFPVVQSPVESDFVNPASSVLPKKKKQAPNGHEVPTVQLEESIALLPSLKAQSIPVFESISDYLTISSEENSQVLANSSKVSNNLEFLTPKEFLIAKAKSLLQKQRQEFEKPLNELRTEGLAETSYRNIERITRGTVNIEREKTGEGSRITGFSIGPLAFSRTTH
jgi:anti-sigma factor RsiW